MNNLKFFLSVKIIILVLVLLTIPALVGLSKPGFFPTQDYIYVARVYQMNKSLLDGQFPVRWVSDFRYGEPLYNFYAPLPYYIGALIKNLGFSYLVTVKLLFALGFILSAISMYFLAKQFFGVLGGVLSAVLYTYAPYHSTDVYVRGALSESYALIFFPLIFLAAFKLSKNPTAKNIIFLALSLGGLFFTHNIMTILFMPFFFGWCAFLLWQEKNIKNVKYFIFAFILGVSLAASFLLPAFFEKDLVQSKKLITGYFDFRAHFVAFGQFFSTFWGYGASLWGPKDDMSFQVGISNWVAIVISAISIIIFKVFSKSKQTFYLITFLAAEFLFSLFMQHNLSTPIWLLFPLLAFTQFPWRFLGISIFLVAFLAGIVGKVIPSKYWWISIFLIIGIITVNINYFRPDSYYLDSVDSHYISPEILAIDDKLPKDYLPIWVKRIEENKRDVPYAVFGRVEVTDFNKRSSSANFKVNVFEDSEIEVPITHFPGWYIKANGQSVNIQPPSDLGLIKFKLTKGEYKVQMDFGNTLVRNIGDGLSLVALLILIILFKKRFLKI